MYFILFKDVFGYIWTRKRKVNLHICMLFSFMGQGCFNQCDIVYNVWFGEGLNWAERGVFRGIKPHQTIIYTAYDI